MNLIVILVVWGAGMVSCYAWCLAMVLRKTFREEVVTEPAGVVEEVRPGGVLNYAKPPRKMNLGRRWPVIHAIAVVGILFPMAQPVLVFVMIVTTFGVLPGVFLPCCVTLSVVLMASVFVAVAGLRDAGGQPAAAKWKYTGRVVLCWLGAVALTWGLLDLRVQRMMDESVVRADRLGKELEIISPEGPRAAFLYTKAGVWAKGTTQFENEWELMDGAGRVTPPPAFPQEAVFRIPLLREAAGMKTGGFVPAASSYSYDIPMPYLTGMRCASNALRLHAISEARTGRIASAIDDINAMRGVAAQTMQGLTVVEVLAGIQIHGQADEALQEVLPMVSDERDLDGIRSGEPADCLRATNRSSLGELGIGDRRTVVMVLRGQRSLVPTTAGTASPASLALDCLYRVALGDAEVSAIEQRIAAAMPNVSDDPAVALGNLPAIKAWSVRERHRSPFSMVMVPFTDIGVGESIEAAAMTDISRGAIAATRFRIQKERLPASWDELVQAKLMPAAPVDPFDGKPIRFAVHKDFVFIYTIGRGRVDNGGAPYVVGRDGAVRQSNRGMIVSGRLLWELDLLPKGFVPATQTAE